MAGAWVLTGACFSERKEHMRFGTVTYFSEQRGYGFVRPDGADRDIFLHNSAFPKTEGRLHVGDRLLFEVGTAKGRPVAVRVTRAAE
jgi:cold shock CspA family protein